MKWFDRVLWLLLPCGHVYLLLGLIFRRSTNCDLFGRYSVKYFVMLVSLSVAFLIWPFLLKRWWRHQGPRATTFLSVLFVVLILFESVPVRPYVGERDGFFHPHLQMVSWHADKGPPPSPYGFRSGPVALEKEKDEIRLVVMGGSTALNLYVDYEQSFGFKLQKKLQKEFPYKKIKVVNAANVWFSSHHSLINYLQRVRPLQPDVVIAFHAVNDMCRSFSSPVAAVENFRVDYSHFLGPQIDLFKRANQGAWSQSNLNYVMSQVLYTELRELNQATRSQGPWPWPSLPVFEKNMNTLVDLVTLDQVKLVLATQGHYLNQDLSLIDESKLSFYHRLLRNNKEGPTLTEVARGFYQFNDVTRQVCAQHHILLVDLEKNIPSDDEYFIDEVHMTEKATEHVAQLFFDALKQELSIFAK